MQTSLSRCQGATKPGVARRSVARVPAFGTTTSRRCSVQVFAKKGKGKMASRQGSMPGQMETMRKEPPVPEVDPENEEFVVFMRCLKYTDPSLNVQMGPSMWIPINLLKGSQALNFVGKAVRSEWGMKLYGRTLIWQISTSLYQEKAALEKKMRKEIPIFANVPSNEFEYAFKIRDKSVPKDWLKAENLTMIPPQSEVGSTGLDQVKAFFSVENFANMFKAPEAPAQQQQ
ncbi:hypothetical protein GPECTOR_92g602 [Gonium pectorale]|uniref:Uncharacterized protein n=1 Tax=Gonium pectorale TaxID=33097 RepID=A0A150G0J9_GONPE|nr:hypothetical protein GPECTOR_92g602 [Gonium pectorale]|eukprot:KXZ43379.1 hypothetical protein GPECTOR_92g602 [Gonium pectorale]